MSNDAVAQKETTGSGKQPALDMGADSITPEMYRKIDTIVERYKDKPGSLIPVLQQATERDLAAKDMESAAGKLALLAEAQLLQGQRSGGNDGDRAAAMSRATLS
jgi:hypothetical protein